jgi:hypothetical protein
VIPNDVEPAAALSLGGAGDWGEWLSRHDRCRVHGRSTQIRQADVQITENPGRAIPNSQSELSADQLRSVLTLKVGDSIALGDHSFYAALTQQLLMVPGVTHVKPNVVCCDNDQAIIFVGIEEKNAPTMHFRPTPKGAIRLPSDVLKTAAELERLDMKAPMTADGPAY